MRNFKAPPLSRGAKDEITRAKEWLQKSNLPLYVEVGCGAGYHPLLFTRANKSARIFAFERTTVKFEKAMTRLRTHLAKSTEYERCFIAHADATHLWSELFKPLSIEGVIFLYPNPYPKKQHANRRLANMPFFDVVIDSLKAGGTILFATNEHPYFEELLTAIQKGKNLKIDHARPVNKDQRPRSHFEKKYLARGQNCFEIVATKIS